MITYTIFLKSAYNYVDYCIYMANKRIITHFSPPLQHSYTLQFCLFCCPNPAKTFWGLQYYSHCSSLSNMVKEEILSQKLLKFINSGRLTSWRTITFKTVDYFHAQLMRQAENHEMGHLSYQKVEYLEKPAEAVWTANWWSSDHIWIWKNMTAAESSNHIGCEYPAQHFPSLTFATLRNALF